MREVAVELFSDKSQRSKRGCETHENNFNDLTIPLFWFPDMSGHNEERGAYIFVVRRFLSCSCGVRSVRMFDPISRVASGCGVS